MASPSIDRNERSYEDSVRNFVQFRNALDECSPEVRDSIEAMIQVVGDPESTEDERRLALHTIADAIFPSASVDTLQSCDAARHSPEAVARVKRMKLQEAEFAKRIEKRMQEVGLTQQDLAEMTGVKQSAISNLLARQCRPQKRTVSRLAQALKVRPEDLWPDDDAEA